MYGNLQIGAIIYATYAVTNVSQKTQNVSTAGYYYFDGNVWQVFNSGLSKEPWLKANTLLEADSNTENIYVMGNVGIGTSNPRELLEIHGTDANGCDADLDMYSYGNNLTSFHINRAGGTPSAPTAMTTATSNITNILNMEAAGYTGTEYKIASSLLLGRGVNNIPENMPGFIQFKTRDVISVAFPSPLLETRMVIIGNGNVGINKGNPAYRLDVGGDINTSGDLRKGGTAYAHPDYVFDNYFDGGSTNNPNYKMLSLSQIEDFVRENKHLPGVQSRQDIEETDSWNVTENVRVNLEKIEELYLHTIEQEKQIEKQQAQIDVLSAQVKALLEVKQ